MASKGEYRRVFSRCLKRAKKEDLTKKEKMKLCHKVSKANAAAYSLSGYDGHGNDPEY